MAKRFIRIKETGELFIKVSFKKIGLQYIQVTPWENNNGPKRYSQSEWDKLYNKKNTEILSKPNEKKEIRKILMSLWNEKGKSYSWKIDSNEFKVQTDDNFKKMTLPTYYWDREVVDESGNIVKVKKEWHIGFNSGQIHWVRISEGEESRGSLVRFQSIDISPEDTEINKRFHEKFELIKPVYIKSEDGWKLI